MSKKKEKKEKQNNNNNKHRHRDTKNPLTRGSMTKDPGYKRKHKK